MELERNKQGKLGKLCALYVLAKAKSRRTQKWVFRGISASSAPLLQRRQLRKGARAFTCTLRMLQTEITHNFQYTDIQSVAGWLSFITRKGTRAITEVDCKKKFDNIHPRDGHSAKQQSGSPKNDAGASKSCTGRSTGTPQS